MAENSKNTIYKYPIIDINTIHNYNKNNINCKHKNFRVTGEKCGKDTITSVKVHRNNKKCIVKANISSFKVEVKINERNKTILTSKCVACKNKTGGCKHIIALLFWLLHQNKTNINIRLPKSSKCQQNHNLPSLDLYVLAEYYKKQSGNTKSIEDFINYCKNNFDENSIEQTAFNTATQANNAQWNKLRYGRITASKIYEATCCKTLNGSLFKVIMGKVYIKKKAIDIGHKLEEKVIKVVEDKLGMKISRVGLYLSKDYPHFGASPDGLTSEYCIEIKCPQNTNSYKKYFNLNNEISTKIMAQLQMQMLFCKRKKGLFCLADPDFANNNQVNIIEVAFDELFIKDLIDKAQIFWENAIFPVLMQA